MVFKKIVLIFLLMAFARSGHAAMAAPSDSPQCGSEERGSGWCGELAEVAGEWVCFSMVSALWSHFLERLKPSCPTARLVLGFHKFAFMPGLGTTARILNWVTGGRKIFWEPQPRDESAPEKKDFCWRDVAKEWVRFTAFSVAWAGILGGVVSPLVYPVCLSVLDDAGFVFKASACCHRR